MVSNVLQQILTMKLTVCFIGVVQAAGKMPTRDRVKYVRRRLRHEYEVAREETDPERTAFVTVKN